MAQVLSLKDDLFEISLEDLMNIKVVTATGSAKKMDNAPAIVSVVTASQIKSWGVSSVGEALTKVPGLYCQYDYISYNCGVRGVNGGAQGQSKVIKVMINGQPVSFRSDTNNYLGPELIPVTAIERIEIVRGPASALYGANAFLGVVNVITKKGLKQGGQLFTQVQTLNNQIGSQHSLSYANEAHKINYQISAQYSQVDRSGLTVPNTLPGLSPISANSKSDDDTAESKVLYVAADHKIDGLVSADDSFMIALDLYYTNMKSSAQWHDYGAFSQTPAALGVNQTLGLSTQYWRMVSEYQYSDSLSFKFSYASSQGSPTSDENLDVGATSFIPRREFGFNAHDVSFESKWKIQQGHQLVLGVDHTNNTETLYEIYRVDRTSGEETLATNSAGEARFQDSAFYFQYSGLLRSNLELTLNSRIDEHNVYGGNLSHRAGLIYEFNQQMSAKVLYGTSFKAPAATQLYAQPLFSGEVNGNDQLDTESAETTEVQLNWQPSKTLKYAFTLFNTKVKDKIEVVGTQAENIGAQTSKGAEAEIQFAYRKMTLAGNLSYQETTATTQDPTGGSKTSSGALYPKLISNLMVNYKVSEQVFLNAQYQIVSERRASDSNIALNSTEPYQLDSYQIFDTSVDFNLPKGSVFLKIRNAFDETYEYTGFDGIDIPGQPRTIFIGGRYEF